MHEVVCESEGEGGKGRRREEEGSACVWSAFDDALRSERLGSWQLEHGSEAQLLVAWPALQECPVPR